MQSTITDITKHELMRRARIGAEYLDATRPGWAGEINLDELDMGSCWDCVIGQIFGDYSEAIDEFAPHDMDIFDVTGWAKEHGFDVSCLLSIPPDEQLVVLNAAWAAEVERRLPPT